MNGGNGPTPPDPPFARGGKVLVPPGVDPAHAGVESSEPVRGSVFAAYCLPPTAKPIGLVGPMSNFA